MRMKLTIFATVLSVTLLLAAPSQAFAAASPSAKVLTIAPTSVQNIYSVIFEVCSSDSTNMRAPEVIVRSLAEVKTVQLNKVLAKDTCTITATQLSAFDPANIKIKVVDKTKLNKMIDQSEKNLIKTKSEISMTNADLQALYQSLGGNSPTKQLDIQKINDLTSKLSDLRKELKETRADYFRLLYLLKAN